MQESASVYHATVPEYHASSVRAGISLLWPALAAISMALLAGAVLARMLAGPRFDGLLVFAAGAAAMVLCLRLLAREPEVVRATAVATTDPLKDLFESAGPGVVSLDLNGRVTYVNPSAERMLGYHAEELMREWSTFDILGPGEGARLVSEMEKLCGIDQPVAHSRPARLAAYMECVRSLPPSHVPSFDAQLRHKDGELIPVTLHTSALRDSSGTITGMVAIAIDQSETLRQDQAQRESQERYRDLFENSSEMIATLSPAGKILYDNPALKR